MLGSVEWLENRISDIELRFSNWKDIPSVVYGFKEEGKVKKWYTLMVIGGSPKTEENLWEVCEEYRSVWISYSSKNDKASHVWLCLNFLLLTLK